MPRSPLSQARSSSPSWLPRWSRPGSAAWRRPQQRHWWRSDCAETSSSRWSRAWWSCWPFVLSELPPLPPVIRAHLGSAAADGHRAPRAGAVPRMVIEDPAAHVPGTCFHAAPSPPDHFGAHDGQEVAERLVQTIFRALEAKPSHRVDLDPEAEPGQFALELSDHFRRRRLTVVGERHGPEQLAEGAGPLKVAIPHFDSPGCQATSVEPRAEGTRGVEPLDPSLDVERVHEQLDDPKISRRRRLRAGLIYCVHAHAPSSNAPLDRLVLTIVV